MKTGALLPYGLWKLLWRTSCYLIKRSGLHAPMSEIVSRVFVIGVLLFYAGLVVALLLWNLGRRVHGPGKKEARTHILGRLSVRRIFDRHLRTP